MKKRLILHIGMHKTGSTSIQRFFSRNRRLLGLLGLCYPISIGPDGRRQPKHNAIFSAISHEADFGAAHPALGPSANLIDSVAEEIARAPGRTAVMSAEGFSGERPVFAQALAPLARRFDVTIVMFVRRQDLWVESFYKQMVQSREVRLADPFAAFLSRPETAAHMDYATIAAWWADAFSGRIVVSPFEPDIDATTPLSLFLRAADLSPRLAWAPYARARENPSPPTALIEQIRQANADGRESAPDANQRRGEVGAYLSQSERIQLMNRYDPGNRDLLRYLRSPQRRRLFLQPII